MPAFARVVLPGVPHHVTQRGNYQQNVFFSDEDRATYLNKMISASISYGLELHGWCLMSNHVHWIVVPSDEAAMAEAFRRAHSSYAAYINKFRKERSGHLWQGRFYSCPLDELRFGTALLYVELNPVRAKMTRDASSYDWSTAAARSGRGPVPQGLQLDRWMKTFSQQEWRQMLQQGQEAGNENEVRISTQQGKPCGSKEFLQEAQRLIGRDLTVRPKGRPKHQNVDGGSFYPSSIR